MPIASTLAAVIGILLMLWNRVVIFTRKLIQSFRQPTPKLHTHHPPIASHRVTVSDRRD
jgi:hypothetical protein